MNPKKNATTNDVVEKPKKKDSQKDTSPKKYQEPNLPSAPPKDKPGAEPKQKPGTAKPEPQPEKRPKGPVEDNKTPDEFISKKKLNKETRKIRESEHLY